MVFRYAERKDTALILRFIKELAAYEKLLDEVGCGRKKRWKNGCSTGRRQKLFS